MIIIDNRDYYIDCIQNISQGEGAHYPILKNREGLECHCSVDINTKMGNYQQVSCWKEGGLLLEGLLHRYYHLNVYNASDINDDELASSKNQFNPIQHQRIPFGSESNDLNLFETFFKKLRA